MAKYPYMLDVGETRKLDRLEREGIDATYMLVHGRKGKLLARYDVSVDGTRIGRVICCGRGRYYYCELDCEPGTMFSLHYFAARDAAETAAKRWTWLQKQAV